ncbi:MAG: AtpZ/AtpI family protein [Rhodobacteraceae bacterium]|nr:AtpZ/AtpI family protein [Paracoccaceae bacterium]
MSEDPFSERLKRLEDRIEAARASRAEPVSRVGAKYTQGSLAWRMVTELVAGMLLGLGIGWGLDRLLGTQPAFLVLFVLLGFAAGIRVMMRTAAEVREGKAEGALMRPSGAVRGVGRQRPGTETEAGPRRPDGERGTDGDDRG